MPVISNDTFSIVIHKIFTPDYQVSYPTYDFVHNHSRSPVLFYTVALVRQGV